MRETLIGTPLGQHRSTRELPRATDIAFFLIRIVARRQRNRRGVLYRYSVT